jgi:hypothetical protein
MRPSVQTPVPTKKKKRNHPELCVEDDTEGHRVTEGKLQENGSTLN